MTSAELRRRLARLERQLGPPTPPPSDDEIIQRFKGGGFSDHHVEQAYVLVRHPMAARAVIVAASARVGQAPRAASDPWEILVDWLAFPDGADGSKWDEHEWLRTADFFRQRKRSRTPACFDAMAAVVQLFWQRQDVARLHQQVSALCEGEIVEFLVPFGEEYRRAERISDAMLVPERLVLTNGDQLGRQEVDNTGQTWTRTPIQMWDPAERSVPNEDESVPKDP